MIRARSVLRKVASRLAAPSPGDESSAAAERTELILRESISDLTDRIAALEQRIVALEQRGGE